jgi:leucyl-tRNA---protein transferase
MFPEGHVFDNFKGNALDYFLSIGWYRMGASLFTTRTIHPFNNEIALPVYWLRYIVGDVNLSKKNRELIARNSSFSYQYKAFQLTEDVIELHRLYTQNLKFTTSGSLITLLEDLYNQVFDSIIIEVRDQGKLIAAGIFDLGSQSIAGIINIYNPEYKKYSPGKFLILLKYYFCVKNKLPYYYPGYYTPKHPIFDYKLFPDKNATEVFLPDDKLWIPYHKFVALNIAHP